jgi:hypothetical protein
MMKNEKNIVDGYFFEDEETLKEAKNEMEGVEYLKKRTNYSNPASVLKIYNTVIEKKLFKTPIGYEFLRELQEYLFNNDKISADQIEAIPVYSPKSKKKVKFNMPKIRRVVDKTSPYRSRFINMVILNVILILFLVLFIFISNNSKNLNIINYQNRLEAEYTQKEDNLVQWEKDLSEREKQLSTDAEQQ